MGSVAELWLCAVSGWKTILERVKFEKVKLSF